MGEIKAKVTSKGQVKLPDEILRSLGVEPGDEVRFVEQADGSFVLKKRSETLADLRGLLRDKARTITQDEIEAWIDEARSRAWPQGSQRSKP